MAVKINFDSMYNPIQPTIVLATKGGQKLGVIPNDEFVFRDSMLESSELSFKVDKRDCNRNGLAEWDEISDFKLVWAKDWNKLYELHVQVDEDFGVVKNAMATSLGEAELSQINLYDMEFNTEGDILREDYVPSIIYNANNRSGSMLARMLEKAPHYRIKYISPSIARLQRTFTFNGTSIYDAFQEIATEVECVFVFDCYFDANGTIQRDISVYDLKSHCLNPECYERGSFRDTCPKCGGTNIEPGYGNDTSIFVSSQNLAESINYEVDVKSVKNCFKLEAGDDLMTATIASCNPNGTPYIWYITDEIKKDMSPELIAKLNAYDNRYNDYQSQKSFSINSGLLGKYNALIDKYSAYSTKYKKITSPIYGYPALMQANFDAIDFYMYLSHELMPNVTMQNTTASNETSKLTNEMSVAIRNAESASKATVDSYVLSYAKYLVDSRYKVEIVESAYSGSTWRGKFKVTNYSDNDDTASTSNISVSITSNFETYIRQMLNKTLKSNEGKDTPYGIVEIFALGATQFENELHKYSLSSLKNFHDACNGCISVLMEHGVSNPAQMANVDEMAYENIYVPYYNKLSLIEKEIKSRENEISIIAGEYAVNGRLISDGIQTIIEKHRSDAQEVLNFEEFLGHDLLMEFSSYRRDDTYTNKNYISDGLNNAEIFENAMQFINVAKEEIYKSASLQHSIKANLRNLLVIKEFEPLVNMFEVGNWIRLLVDEEIFKLRILNYEINFSDLGNIEIEFSDIYKSVNGYGDVRDIIKSAASMATSYDYVARQAKKGEKSNAILANWVENSLALTQTKIINDADNQNIEFDKYGMSCKQYIPELDSYDDKQLKIINRGLYVTDDNWKTAKAGIGNFIFYNPKSGEYEEGYGVIADTIVGNIILSEEVGVYNEAGSISLDRNGFTLTSDTINNQAGQTSFTIQKIEMADGDTSQITRLLYLDTDGNLVLNGSIRINTDTGSADDTLNDITNPDRFMTSIHDEIIKEKDNIMGDVNSQYQELISSVDYQLTGYRAEIGQFMNFDNDGLTLGSIESNFKTVIDNQGMRFKEGDTTISYITNNQLYINDAVINNTLKLGKFFFSPHSDGGVSLTWQG